MRPTRAQLLVLIGVATVALYAVLFVLDPQFVGTGGPSILALEFAGSADRVEEIAGEWGSDGVHLARLSLWIDFPFMLCYGAFFLLAGLATRDFAREHRHRRLASIGLVAPYAAVAAAGFDACENVIWLFALDGHALDLVPVGTACAVAKFALIAIAQVYAICGLVLWLRLRRAGSR